MSTFADMMKKAKSKSDAAADTMERDRDTRMLDIKISDYHGTSEGRVLVKLIPPTIAELQELEAKSMAVNFHGVTTPTGEWRYKACPSQYNKPCPVCKEAWSSKRGGDNHNFRRLLAQKRFFANVLVLESDIEEDVGQIKLFRYDWKLDKLIADMDQKGIDVFNHIDSSFCLEITRTKKPESKWFDEKYDFNETVHCMSEDEMLENMSKAHSLKIFLNDIEANGEMTIEDFDNLIEGNTRKTAYEKNDAPAAETASVNKAAPAQESIPATKTAAVTDFEFDDDIPF